MTVRGLAAAALLLALAPADAAHAAPAAAPDSFAVLKQWIRERRPSDPSLVALAERVVERRTLAGGANDPGVAEALLVLGHVHLTRAENRAADSLFVRALAVRRAARRPDDYAIAVAMSWVAEAQRAGKRLAQAESTATEAIATLERSGRREPPDEMRMRGTLGNALAERGDAERATAELAKVVALGESAATVDSVLLAQSHRNLARAYILAGDLAAATAGLERAAAIQERVLRPDDPELATTHYIATFVTQTQGDFVASRRHAERALAIREQAYGPNHPLVAASLAQLGGAVRGLGDGEAAQVYYERAVAILRPLAAQNPADLATALANLGVNSLALGDGRRALACLEESRVLREKVFGPGRGLSFWSTARIAQATMITGSADSAEAILDRLEASSARRTPIDVAESRLIKGTIAYARGRMDRAEAEFDRSFVIRDSLLGTWASPALQSLARRAAARLGLGRTAEAWADARRVERNSREIIRLTARGMSEHEALGIEQLRGSGLELLAAIADEAGARAGSRPPANARPLADSARAQLLDAIVRARLLVLDELADERRALPRDDAALRPLVDELDAARAALAGEMVRALRSGRAPDSTVAAARARREAAERALAERSGPFRGGMRRATAGFADVAAALPPASALVSFLRFQRPGRFAFEETGGAPPPEATRYLALVLRSGASAPEVIPLGPAPGLESAIGRWAEACATPPPAKPALAAAAQRRCDALGRAVRALAWEPVARACGGAERVFVVPDGALHAVNFLALPDDRGRYLAEHGPTIHRLAAERDLLPWAHGARHGSGLLALGGPDFDSGEPAPAPLLAAAVEAPPATRASAAEARRLRFEPLANTALEVHDVATLWRTARPADEMVEERTGEAAGEAAFKRLAPGRRVLHVATHGFALGAPADSVAAGGSAAAESGAPATDSTRAPAAQPAPQVRAIGAVVAGSTGPATRRTVLLPGLALAGANRAPAQGEEDGFLTAEEITSLDLSGVEWAVLSACETGLAQPDAVEAVQGLHRAFRRAGLHTLIVSLWSVDDEATRAWMRRLYGARLLEHRDTAESVREACRATLRERRAAGLDTHPFRWAAFVAAGDWR